MLAWMVGPFAPATADAGGRAAQNTAKPAGRGAQQAGRSGIALQVTDPRGATLPGVQVTLTGPSDRMDETNASGQLSFSGLQAGTYRLRFTGEHVTAFEREITLAAARTATVDVTLTPAPPPREVIKEAPPPPPGPRGTPQALSIPELLDQEFVGREPRHETLLSCSGNLRMTMVQLNEPQPDRLYAESEVTYYVLGGEGTVTMDGMETLLETNDFVSVPRGTRHAVVRRGSRPLVLLATLSGAPCEQAK